MALMVVGGVVMSVLVSVGPASADVSASAGFTVPDGAGVGATNLNASITVSNTNTAPNQNESNSVNEIKFAPSCGAFGSVVTPCGAPDPGVFAVSPVATGATGTACAGQNFSVSAPDASGVVTFVPSGGLLLAAGASCTINFTLNVLKVPSFDVSATPGVQTDVNLRVKETGAVSGVMPVVVVSQTITVNRGIVSLTTQASPSVPVGSSISDTATLTKSAGAPAVTGTVTFRVFGPGDPTCTGAPVAQSTVPVVAGTAQSSSTTATQAGVYRFVASYSGDVNYVSLSSPCNSAGESVNVTSAPARRAVADFNGDGITDISVFRPSTGQWLVKGVLDTVYGGPGDIPVPGNYDANATTDIAVFRPTTGQWLVKGILDTVYGASTDIPVPGDYNGDGITDVAVFRPSTGQWLVKGILDTVYGQAGDIPVTGYYNADNTTDIAVFRPSTGQWLVKGISETVYGASTDVPVPGDYNGDGITDIAVFRPSTGQWLVKGISDTVYGASGDIPVPGNYDAGSTTDIAVFRPSTGQWLVRGISETVYGASTDAPLPLPSAIRRAYFLP